MAPELIEKLCGWGVLGTTDVYFTQLCFIKATTDTHPTIRVRAMVMETDTVPGRILNHVRFQ